MEFLGNLIKSIGVEQMLYNSAPVIAGVIITAFWVKIEKVLKALKELGDVITVINKALADRELTKEEIIQIKKEIGEAVAAFKAILKK